MAETIEQIEELTLEQKTKLANTIKGMKEDGVADEVIQQSVIDIKQSFKQKNSQAIVAKNLFRESVMLPEVEVKGGDGTVTENDFKEMDKNIITDKGNKYLNGIGLEFSPNFTGGVELNDPEANEADPDYESSTIKVGPVVNYLNPSYAGKAEVFVKEKIDLKIKELEDNPEMFFDAELYNKSHEYMWKNTPTINHPTENRYLNVDELDGDQLEDFKKENYDGILNGWIDSDEGQDVFSEIQPEITSFVDNVLPGIQAELLNGDIDLEEATYKIKLAYADGLKNSLQDNEKYQTANQTIIRSVMSNFDSTINDKKNDDYESTFYPPWLQGDLSFFQGIYDQAYIYAPKAANLNSLNASSKKHRNILQNLRILDDYEIGGDDLLLANPYTNQKLDFHKNKEKSSGKVFFSGLNAAWMGEMKDGVYENNFILKQGYYDKQDLRNKLLDLEKAYNFEMQLNIAKDSEFKKQISAMGDTSFLNEMYQFTATIDDWQKELGKQTFNTFAGMFTGSFYSIGIESAGAFGELLDADAVKRVGTKAWDSMSEEQRNDYRLRVLNDGLTDEMITTMIHGGADERFEDPSADRISSKAKSVGMINGILETGSDGFVLFRSGKIVTKLIPERLLAEFTKNIYVNAIKAGKQLTKEMLLTGLVIEPIVENLQEITKEIALFSEGNGWGYTLNEAANLTATTMSTATFMPLGGAITTSISNQYQYSTTESSLANDIKKVEDKLLNELAKDPKNKELQDHYNKALEINQKFQEIVDDATYEDMTSWIKDEDSKLEIIENIGQQVDVMKELGVLEKRLSNYEGQSFEGDKEIENPIVTQQQATVKKQIAEKQKQLVQLQSEVKYVQLTQEYMNDFNKEAIINNGDKNSDYVFLAFENNSEMITYLINQGLDPNTSEGAAYIKAVKEGRNFGSFSELKDENGKNIMVISEENTFDYIKENALTSGFIAGNVIFHEKLHANLRNLDSKKIQEISFNLQRILNESIPGIHDFAKQQIIMSKYENGKDYKINKKGEFTYLSPLAAEEYIAKISDGFAGYTLESMTTQGMQALSDFKDVFSEISKGKLTNENILAFIKSYNKNDMTGPRTESDVWVDENGIPSNFFYNEINIVDVMDDLRMAASSESTVTMFVDAKNLMYTNPSNETILAKTKEMMGDLINVTDNIRKSKSLLDELTIINSGSVASILQKSGFRNELEYILNKEDFELSMLKEYATFMPRWNEDKGKWDGYKPVLTEEEFNKLENPDFKKKVGGDGKFAEYYFNPVPFNAFLNAKTGLAIRVPGIYDKALKAYNDIKAAEDADTNNGGNDVDDVLDMQESIRDNKEISQLRESLEIKEGGDLYNNTIKNAAVITTETAGVIEDPKKFEAGLVKNFKNDWKFVRDNYFPSTPKTSTAAKIPSYRTQKYKDYITNNIDLIYRTMPVSELTKMKMDLTEVEVLDETGRVRMRVKESEFETSANVTNKTAGNTRRSKVKLTEEKRQELIDYYLVEKRSDMRFESTMRYLTNLIYRDAVLTGLQSKEYIDEYGEAKSLIGQVSQIIGKNIDFVFSGVDGKSNTISSSEISPEQFKSKANALVRIIENKNFGSDNLEGVKTTLAAIDEDIEIKELVLKLYDKGFIETADQRQFKAKVIAMKDKKLNDFVTKSFSKGGQGALRFNDNSLKRLNKMAGLIVDEIGPLFDDIGYDILGYFGRVMDPAQFKTEIQNVLDPVTKEVIGTKRVNKLDNNGNTIAGDYYGDLEELKAKVMADAKDIGIISENLRLMTPTSILWRKINKITSDGSLSKKTKLQAIKALNEEIQEANVENIKVCKLVAKTVFDLYQDGKISKIDVYNFYQMQTGIAKGFRGYSSLDYITVSEGKFTINKNEHVDINGNTMFKAYESTVNGNLVALYDAFDNHGSWATDGTTSDQMDINPVTGKKDLLTLDGSYKRFILLDNESKADVYTPGGEPMSEVMVRKSVEEVVAMEKIDIQMMESSGITVLDFDDTLATSKSLIEYTRKDGTEGTLTPAEYARDYQSMLGEGTVFDFSQFNEVVEGKLAPLFNKALKLQGKFGTKNMFILTARPAEAQAAIHAFLNAHGLHIPLENITGLGNSTAEAKALWVAGKVSEGYDNFYFADDAPQNVDAVEDILDQMGVKKKTTLADPGFVISESSLSLEFNTILEQTEGVSKEKLFSDAQGRMRGQAKDKYRILPIMPSAQDFKGLLYSFLAKKELGDQQMQFFEDKLIRPYVRGINRINETRQELKKNYKNLIEKLPKVKVKLTQQIEGTTYTIGQAVRVYLWNKNGMTIPGISKRDEKLLVATVNNDPSLITFADGLSKITQQENGYLQPSEYWTVESIASDLYSLTGKVGRKEFLSEWIENRNEIFGELGINGRLQGPNVAKIEAIYGSKFREALEDMMYRMEYGRNKGNNDRITSNWDNWVNGSVGAIMFFNIRSATLQLISATNYIDMANNNPFAAGTAFLNQPNYWKTVSMLWNSPFLQERLGGESRTINEAELAEFVRDKDDKFSAALSYLLKIGFTPTRLADATAITMGGATYYINQKKMYTAEGMSEKDADARAMEDWIAKSQEAQQSSDPMMISQQQAGGMGRLLLAFKNTPMQYARLIEKAVKDLAAGRGDTKSNLAKIAYYGAVQNYVFNFLQNALWKAEAEGEDLGLTVKEERMINGMLDSLLSGLGLGGNVVATLKNGVLKYNHEEKKGWNADHTYTILQLANLSPTIGSKLRKIYGSIQSKRFNKEVIKEMPYWNLGNPAFDVMANLVSGLTNIPLDRAVNKIHNLMVAADSETEFWDSFALVLGWNVWDLGLKTEAKKVKEELKEKKKVSKKQCTATKTKGGRCKNKTSNKSGKCYAHEGIGAKNL
jgi:hypothetical protein